MQCALATYHTGAANAGGRCACLQVVSMWGASTRPVPGVGAHPVGAWAAADRRPHLRPTVLTRSAADQQNEATLSASTDNEEWVEVGRVGPPHGVRGEMKVQPLTDFPEDRLGEPGPRCGLRLLAPCLTVMPQPAISTIVPSSRCSNSCRLCALSPQVAASAGAQDGAAAGVTARRSGAGVGPQHDQQGQRGARC